MYDDFYNSFHLDEKWFFLTEENMHFYSTKAEVEAEKTPKRLCAHKPQDNVPFSGGSAAI
jgi:hypothetical protein